MNWQKYSGTLRYVFHYHGIDTEVYLQDSMVRGKMSGKTDFFAKIREKSAKFIFGQGNLRS